MNQNENNYDAVRTLQNYVFDEYDNMIALVSINYFQGLFIK